MIKSFIDSLNTGQCPYHCQLTYQNQNNIDKKLMPCLFNYDINCIDCPIFRSRIHNNEKESFIDIICKKLIEWINYKEILYDKLYNDNYYDKYQCECNYYIQNDYIML